MLHDGKLHEQRMAPSNPEGASRRRLVPGLDPDKTYHGQGIGFTRETENAVAKGKFCPCHCCTMMMLRRKRMRMGRLRDERRRDARVY